MGYKEGVLMLDYCLYGTAQESISNQMQRLIFQMNTLILPYAFIWGMDGEWIFWSSEYIGSNDTLPLEVNRYWLTSEYTLLEEAIKFMETTGVQNNHIGFSNTLSEVKLNEVQEKIEEITSTAIKPEAALYRYEKEMFISQGVWINLKVVKEIEKIIESIQKIVNKMFRSLTWEIQINSIVWNREKTIIQWGIAEPIYYDIIEDEEIYTIEEFNEYVQTEVEIEAEATAFDVASEIIEVAKERIKVLDLRRKYYF